MHQNQWLAAIAKLEALEGPVVPSNFPREHEKHEVIYTLFNFSSGNESAQGRWASGKSMDNCGVFNYDENPVPLAPKPVLNPASPYTYDTLPQVLTGQGPPIKPC